MADAWIGLLVALGCGLLVGVEREQRKGRGPQRGAAGIRTFTLVTLAGALAQALAPGALVAAGLLAVGLLAAAAYWRSSLARSSDPGLTTEVALVVAYLVGVQCVVQPALGAACAAVLAGLLAARENMHRFATEWLTELELRDALVLAGVALVIVPLAPASALPWLGGLAPRTAAWLVLVILSIQGAAHVARRVLGLRGGAEADAEVIAENAGPPPPRRPLRLREAASVAAALLLVSAAVAWAQTQFGSSGRLAGTALAALADAHAPIAASLALHQAGELSASDALRAALLAVSVNTGSRCAVAAFTGGPLFAWRVGRVLVLSVGAAGLALWLSS